MILCLSLQSKIGSIDPYNFDNGSLHRQNGQASIIENNKIACLHFWNEMGKILLFRKIARGFFFFFFLLFLVELSSFLISATNKVYRANFSLNVIFLLKFETFRVTLRCITFYAL